MSMATLKAQHKAFVQSMYDEGMLDHQFAQLQALQDAENPEFVVEVITLFCNDAERILTELNNYLGRSVVDYSNVRAYVHQLQGSSSSIGAQKIKLSCGDLRLASDNRNKGRVPAGLE